MKNNMHIGVIGAGVMGLAAAYHALKKGYRVTIYETDTVPGGMAAHFDFEGLSLERFYHFVCKADKPLFHLLKELGMEDSMIWAPTSMGYYIDGKHYNWGDPVSLLTFPLLSLWDKFRYGLTMFLTTKTKNWDRLEHINAKDWIIRTCGQNVYKLLWQRLFTLKFFEYSGNISAAWIATRIKRIGTSRRSLFQEELGYIKGGSEALVSALCTHITAMGGEIKLGQKVHKVMIDKDNNQVTGIATDDGEFLHDTVISTAPVPYINALIPDLPQAWKDMFDAINNIGCVCVVIKLAKPLTRHFWLNINDPQIEIPGLVEYSNLRNLGEDHIIYLPYYMPQNHEKFSWTDDDFRQEAQRYIHKINPVVTEKDIIAIKVGRLKYAQPVCEPGFASKIPPVQSPVAGLFIADTCYYYPEDRGISESVRLAKEIIDDIHTPRRENSL